MDTRVTQTDESLEILLPENLRELQLWIVDQMTILAEAFGESVTGNRMRIYAKDLCDLQRPQLGIAFARARRELKFFPKISELRELAGAKAEDARKVEADAAWQFANEYLRKWGVDHLSLYFGGKCISPPALPPRIDYALRRIGGLRGLNQVTAESRPFVQKEFVEAYQQAPVAESLSPQLERMFGNKMLIGQMKQLASGASHKETARTPEKSQVPLKIKKVPEPMTDAQIRDRREMLRQQIESLMAKKEMQAESA